MNKRFNKENGWAIVEGGKFKESRYIGWEWEEVRRQGRQGRQGMGQTQSVLGKAGSPSLLA